ncbi:MAG: ABC transporter substrate-binding protein [Pseudorhodobacter sp.]
MIRFTRRNLLATAGAATCLSLSAPRILRAQNALPELTTMRSTSKSWLWAVEDYANTEGFFTEAGVSVISNASQRGNNVPALQGGGVDIVLGAPAEALRAQARNLKIHTIASMVNRYASHVMLKKEIMEKAGVTEASPAADKIALLRGLKLGTTGSGAAPDALFRYLAMLGGMNPDTDFQLVPIQGGGSGILAALGQNVIDGFCLSSPTADMSVAQQNCDYLFQMVLNPPEQLREYQYIIATVGDETIASKRTELVGYCRGLALAQRSIANEPERFQAWAKIWFEGIPPEIFDTAFANNSKIYFADPTPSKALHDLNINFINTVNSMMNVESLPDTLTYEATIDPTLAQEAVKDL